MTTLTADELVKQSHVRTWYQLGTGTTRYFYGNPGYHFISGATMQVRGAIDPVFLPDPPNPGRYRLVSRTNSPPDLDEFSVDFHESHGTIPRAYLSNRCAWTFFELHSRCGDPTDFHRGWESMMIYAEGLFDGGIDLGTRSAADSDDPLTGSATFKARAIYPIGPLSFGEEASSEVVVEVVDVIYGKRESCGECGMVSDGSTHIYALTRANVGSPAAPGQLVYSLDGGASWSTATITGLGASDEPLWLDLVGSSLVVATAGTSIFATTLSETGAPTTWSSVFLGFSFVDCYVQSPASVWLCRSNTVTKFTNLLANATSGSGAVSGSSLQRVHGTGNVVVACGSNGGVGVSLNDGLTWSSHTAGSATHQALAVTGTRTWWLGDTDGVVRVTTDGGASYTTVTLPGAAPSTIFDIVFATPECGWISAQVDGVARLYATMDGGYSWARDDGTSRIVNWPTFQRARRLAAPTTTAAIAANNLAVAGLSTTGTDGILIVSSATVG